MTQDVSLGMRNVIGWKGMLMYMVIFAPQTPVDRFYGLRYVLVLIEMIIERGGYLRWNVWVWV